MQTAERPQHAPDHLQSQTVEPRKLVEEQRVDCPVRRGEVCISFDFYTTKNQPLPVTLPVCVGHSLFVVVQTGFITDQFVVKQLVQTFPDQVPRAHQEVSERTQWLVN